MSIATAITSAQGKVANAYTAISNKGGTLPATQNLANMPTAINSIPSGGGSSEKYGANINTLLGDVNTNGVLQLPTEQSDLVFTGVKDVVAEGLYYKFAYSKVKSVSFPNLTTISGSNACYEMFYHSTSLTSASFPNLTTISGNGACQEMFRDCTSLTSASFPNLTTISGSNACNGMFYISALTSVLTSVSFPNLTTLSGNYACQRMFYYNRALTDVYFSALTTSSFGSNLNQFSNMMQYTGSNVTHTLHFPSNLENTISRLTGYPLFGGTSGYVVLSFDLPATS